MLHQEISEKIIGCCFDVSNELGSGFLESAYEKALLHLLREKGLKAISQAPITVKFRDQIVGEFFADILIEDKIVVELKAVKKLAPEHLAQVINYLKSTGFETGLLINFGCQKLEYRRLNNKIESLD